MRFRGGLVFAVVALTGCWSMAGLAMKVAESSSTMSASLAAMRQMQTAMALMSMTGCASVAGVPLAPGEYVRFHVSDEVMPDSAAGVAECAYLGDDRTGYHWWKVKTTEDKDPTAVAVFEFGYDAKAQLGVYRYRLPGEPDMHVVLVDRTAAGKDPQKQVVPAKAVVEDPPIRTDFGIENVSVPAGTFAAKHIRVQSPDVTYDQWTSDSVPGGSVKLTVARKGSKPAVAELIAQGTGAHSELGTQIAPR